LVSFGLDFVEEGYLTGTYESGDAAYVRGTAAARHFDFALDPEG
jgi:hypothetical protein